MLICIRRGDFPVDRLFEFNIDKNQINKNVNGIIWKDRNEFEYDGKLYDVVYKIENDDIITLVCLNDLTEEYMVKNFNDEINDLASGKLNHSKFRTSLLNLISQAVFLNSFYLPYETDRHVLFAGFVPELLSVIADIPLPPPKHTWITTV